MELANQGDQVRLHVLVELHTESPPHRLVADGGLQEIYLLLLQVKALLLIVQPVEDALGQTNQVGVGCPTTEDDPRQAKTQHGTSAQPGRDPGWRDAACPEPGGADAREQTECGHGRRPNPRPIMKTFEALESHRCIA